jgi:hypothetical protein
MTTSVDKERLITHIDVIQFILEGEDNVSVWKVKNQTHPNVICNPNFPFIEYAASKLLFFWHAPTLLMMISSIIMACDMGIVVVG